ncbi:sugar phosphate isomerase/epimerase family protein [Aquabacter sp. CN5-332]|uniref:sugar phosphate isomerase/epimerase family protein n=1 Tax=Aquabacter sp. CN5-332 TaxID=3156608 RepID=UPI0032B5BE38
MVEPARLSLNTATVRERWTLRQCIEGCARHGIGGISPWRDMLAACGVAEAARLIQDHGLTVTGLCRGGMFPAATASGFQRNLDDNRRAIDEAAAIGARCLVLVVGGLPEGSKSLAGARAQVREGIAAVLDHARRAGIPLAIEPLHPMYAGDRSCVTSLAEANDLCDALGPGVGIALDVYHVWWDAALAREIVRAGRERLLAFHVCDWLVPTRDLLFDRGMMGDGVIDIPLIRRMVEAVGYDGLIEVEIFSRDHWWKEDPDEVLRTLIARARTSI